jgi:hypothetical protein
MPPYSNGADPLRMMSNPSLNPPKTFQSMYGVGDYKPAEGAIDPNRKLKPKDWFSKDPAKRYAVYLKDWEYTQAWEKSPLAIESAKQFQQAWNEHNMDKVLGNDPNYTSVRNANGSTTYTPKPQTTPGGQTGSAGDLLPGGAQHLLQTQLPSPVNPGTGGPMGNAALSTQSPSGYPPMLSRMGAKPNTQYGFGGATYTPEMDYNPKGFNPYKPYG